MTRSGLTIVALGLLGYLAWLLAVPGSAAAQTVFGGSPAPQDCYQAVDARLDQLGIAQENVKGVKILERYQRDRFMSGPRVRNRPRKRLIGYTAWVTPVGGKGNVAMDLFLNCRVQRVYTTGGYELPKG